MKYNNGTQAIRPKRIVLMLLMILPMAGAFGQTLSVTEPPIEMYDTIRHQDCGKD